MSEPDPATGVEASPLAAAFADGPAFVPYLVAGDPDVESSKAYLEALDRGGADVLELGLPFSEPIAEGPTIQSAIVRALEAGMTVERYFEFVEALDVDAGALETDAARELLREVARFPAAIEAAADDLEPHTIATFTREFADAYNAFYRECPVVTAETEALRDARLAVVAAAKHTMSNALDVLGVEAPESM